MTVPGERDKNLSSPAAYTIKIPSEHVFISLWGEFVESTNLQDWSITSEVLKLQQFSSGRIVVRYLQNIKEKQAINIYYKDNLILTLLFN